jgi:hypothetical protein
MATNNVVSMQIDCANCSLIPDYCICNMSREEIMMAYYLYLSQIVNKDIIVSVVQYPTLWNEDWVVEAYLAGKARYKAMELKNLEKLFVEMKI